MSGVAAEALWTDLAAWRRQRALDVLGIVLLVALSGWLLVAAAVDGGDPWPAVEVGRVARGRRQVVRRQRSASERSSRRPPSSRAVAAQVTRVSRADVVVMSSLGPSPKTRNSALEPGVAADISSAQS